MDEQHGQPSPAFRLRVGVRCPRCAYDLRGQVAMWHPQGAEVDGASCPLMGMCSECGLEFEWRLVMRPALAVPIWLVEASTPPDERFGWFGLRGAAEFAKRALSTQARLLTPGRFWKRVTLEAPVRPSRLLAWLVSFPLGLPLLLLLTYAALSVHNFAGGAWDIASLGRGVERMLATIGRDLERKFLTDNYFLSPWHSTLWASALLACGLMSSFMLLVLPDTRRVAKVRPRHVLRVYVYGLGWVALALALELGQLVVARSLNGVPLEMGTLGSYEFEHRWGRDTLIIVDRSDGMYRPVVSFAFITACACISWWIASWWFALSRGLRLANHRQVFLASTVAGVLLGLLVGAAWMATL